MGKYRHDDIFLTTALVQMWSKSVEKLDGLLSGSRTRILSVFLTPTSSDISLSITDTYTQENNILKEVLANLASLMSTRRSFSVGINKKIQKTKPRIKVKVKDWKYKL